MKNDDVGLGIDIVEVPRIERIISRSPAFVQRVYTEDERAYCEAARMPEMRYAARFAAKEAVLKALGTGFSHGIRPRDVEVVSKPKQPPRVVLHGKAQQRAKEMGVVSLPISLSHSHKQAIACAMAITRASVESERKRKDPNEELIKQFKSLRSVLDEPVENGSADVTLAPDKTLADYQAPGEAGEAPSETQEDNSER